MNKISYYRVRIGSLLMVAFLFFLPYFVFGQSVPKKSVAVMPFGNDTAYPELTALAEGNINNTFVKTGRFNVIERAQLEKVMKEQAIGMTGAIDPTTAANVGKLLGANLVVLGQIVQADWEDKSHTDDKGVHHPEFHAVVGVQVKIVDVETGKILFSETQTQRKKTESSTANQKLMMSGAIDVANKELKVKIENAFPVEGYIIIVKDPNKSATIDLGTDLGIDKKTKLKVVREGPSIKHPVTGQIIPGAREEICEIEVVSASNLTSEVKINKYYKDPPNPIKVGDKVVTLPKSRSRWEKLGDEQHR